MNNTWISHNIMTMTGDLIYIERFGYYCTKLKCSIKYSKILKQSNFLLTILQVALGHSLEIWTKI